MRICIDYQYAYTTSNIEVDIGGKVGLTHGLGGVHTWEQMEGHMLESFISDFIVFINSLCNIRG